MQGLGCWVTGLPELSVEAETDARLAVPSRRQLHFRFHFSPRRCFRRVLAFQQAQQECLAFRKKGAMATGPFAGLSANLFFPYGMCYRATKGTIPVDSPEGDLSKSVLFTSKMTHGVRLPTRNLMGGAHCKNYCFRWNVTTKD